MAEEDSGNGVQLISSEAAARILGVSRQTVCNWARDGRLPHTRGKNYVLFDARDVERIAEARRLSVGNGEGSMPAAQREETSRPPLRRVSCNYYKSFDWRVLRARVLERDNWRCRYCGTVAVTADHIIPMRAGGANSLDNLVAVCTACNGVLADYAFPSFEERYAYVIEEREALREPRKPKPARARLRVTIEDDSQEDN